MYSNTYQKRMDFFSSLRHTGMYRWKYGKGYKENKKDIKELWPALPNDGKVWSPWNFPDLTTNLTSVLFLLCTLCFMIAIKSLIKMKGRKIIKYWFRIGLSTNIQREGEE